MADLATHGARRIAVMLMGHFQNCLPSSSVESVRERRPPYCGGGEFTAKGKTKAAGLNDVIYVPLSVGS